MNYIFCESAAKKGAINWMELGVFALQEFKELHIPSKRFKADFRLGQLFSCPGPFFQLF